MGHIRYNTHEILSSSQNVTNDMNDSIEAVTQSSTRIQAINDRVQDFKGKIGKIEEIVDLVKKVANQSNLLALNASVEAARAGESGKGFAVVADQVRQLSINTAESAEDIVKYVSELKTNIDELATAMEETTQSLGEGSKKVEKSLAAFLMILIHRPALQNPLQCRWEIFLKATVFYPKTAYSRDTVFLRWAGIWIRQEVIWYAAVQKLHSRTGCVYLKWITMC